MEELKVEPVDKNLRKYKSNWLHKLTRMNNNGMQKIVLNYNQMDEDELKELRRDSFIV